MRLMNTFFILKKARINPSLISPSKGSHVATHVTDLSSCKGYCLQQGRIVYSFKTSSLARETNCWVYSIDEISCAEGVPCQTILMDDDFVTEFIPWNLSRPSRAD